MWKFKTDRLGNITPAVQRRLSKLEVDIYFNTEVDTNSHKSRAEFGYNYLEYVH